MGRISRKDVERTAELARIDLSESEVEGLTRDLDRILEHAQQLAMLETEGIEPTAHALPLPTPTRPDRPASPMDPERALGNAPLREGSAFVVPKVLDGEEG
ncbi:MAG: Asp-tRNA(Asn)/Glu-tRNA(Gln) amidotransferase subunit GatC [Myxococcota bacterium]|nr:Asp-tRNA(Asn)/Glu-tRNA(Gln) amidotransferase subunit GatC [Myxococcota bacterium]